MPRKTKEVNLDESKKTTKPTKQSSKKVVSSTNTKTKKTVAETKKPTTKKSSSKGTVKKTTSKEVAPKETSSKKTTKKATSVKATSTKPVKKTTSTKTASKKPVKKASSTKTASKKPVKKTTPKVAVIEYYDLPYRYNQTIVKLLAQTPKILFVYWDISDNDRNNFINTYGEDFFNKTKPVLIIHNETMNYSFEVDINDFANSWYLHINDANCKYHIELGRRPISNDSGINTDYIYVSSSNGMDAPNNHILFENFNPNVSFKNVKTGAITKRNFSYMLHIKDLVSIFEFYKNLYEQNLLEEMIRPDFANPSSLSSSKFK